MELRLELRLELRVEVRKKVKEQGEARGVRSCGGRAPREVEVCVSEGSVAADVDVKKTAQSAFPKCLL
jgi:hypothetical protein